MNESPLLLLFFCKGDLELVETYKQERSSQPAAAEQSERVNVLVMEISKLVAQLVASLLVLPAPQYVRSQPPEKTRNPFLSKYVPKAIQSSSIQNLPFLLPCLHHESPPHGVNGVAYCPARDAAACYRVGDRDDSKLVASLVAPRLT